MSLSDYEETLKSYIHDDDKLVTYKWLSKEFEIHVNAAKDLLKQYWKKNKDEEKIIATFLLVGQLKDGSIRVEVVKDENLNDAKDKFIKVNCEHLYSLQKSLQDIELLALVGDGDLRFSAIKCNEQYIRSNEEIESLRYIGNKREEENKSVGKVGYRATEKQVSKQADSSSKEQSKNGITRNQDIKEKEMLKEKEKPVDYRSEEKTEVLEKKVSPKNNSKDSTKINNKVAKKPVQSKQSGFNNLFGKPSSKLQVLGKEKEDSDNSEKANSTRGAMKKEEVKISKDKDTNSSKDEQDKNDKEKGKDKARDNSEKKNKNKQSEEKTKTVSKAVTKTESKVDMKSKNKKDMRGKKRNRSQEKDKSSKRKRIVVIDSSEDESAKSHNEEEEEPMEIVEEPIKITKRRSLSPPAEKRENGKRMVSKYIDKTFKDEDGYLVTKRVQVYEVASDDEEPAEVEKEEPQKPKTLDTKAKKKQTTLMNFFKKS